MEEYFRKQTLLIVDDTPANIDILDGILNKDYKIKVAISGEIALKIIKIDSPPDLILLDIMMPEMDGYEVCRQLKLDPVTKNIPVIFVSEKNKVMDESKGFNAGAVDYIAKPVSPPLVKARIKTHLALYHQNRLLEQKVKIRTSKIVKTRLEIIRRLGRAAEYKDNETGLHVIRMSKYSQLIALSLSMTEEEAMLLLNVAPMHDIGKIGIADNILRKKGPLSPDEWKIMKTHTEIGANIIGKHSSKLLKTAKIAALSHHEKWNGKGYPFKVKGNKIPLVGRILAVADVFDALTSKRPYKEAWPIDDAINLIEKESGEHFDPEIVSAFLRSMPQILDVKNKYSENIN